MFVSNRSMNSIYTTLQTYKQNIYIDIASTQLSLTTHMCTLLPILYDDSRIISKLNFFGLLSLYCLYLEILFINISFLVLISLLVCV